MALEDTFATYGVPEGITHDGGPPYQSRDWRRFARKHRFETKMGSPEHPQGNGIVERFMAVIKKTIHAAKSEGKDPKEAVRLRVFNYRNTPHPATGEAPATLMFGRNIKTKIPALPRLVGKEALEKAKEVDKEERKKRKEVFDKKKKTKSIEAEEGSKVLIKQKSTTVKPPYDPEPYEVVKRKGDQVTIERGERRLKRHLNEVKILKERKRQPKKQEEEKQEDSGSEMSDIEVDQDEEVEVHQEEVHENTREEETDSSIDEITYYTGPGYEQVREVGRQEVTQQQEGDKEPEGEEDQEGEGQGQRQTGGLGKGAQRTRTRLEWTICAENYGHYCIRPHLPITSFGECKTKKKNMLQLSK